MISIGTSGFFYDDWRGFFYPDDLPKDGFLSFYAQHFSTLELNFSYYKMPTAKMLSSMLERTEGKVDFAIKAHRSMTHDRTCAKRDFEAFNEALSPLREARKLAAVLAQFPYSFKQTEENRAYVKQLTDNIGHPLVIEPRNADWATGPILKWFSVLGVGFCCVDEPQIKGLMPPLAVVTASPAYVRFHGRNAQKWYTHDRPEERYDYRYTDKELAEWVPKINLLATKSDKVLVFFNNHFQSKAVDGAKKLSKMLFQMQG